MPILTDDQRKHYKQQDIKHEIQKACQIDDRRDNDLQPKFDVINGCTEIEVDIIDYNVNPYKAMVDGILHTWADNQHNNKWKYLSPEARFAVVKECIEGRALPLAFEIPQISFQITGITRACADQIMRQRIGAVFFAKGVRDNNCSKWRVICPTKIYKNEKLYGQWRQCMQDMKLTYTRLLSEGKSDWQSARSLLPMNIEYSLQSTMNLQSLKGQFARRLISTEQYDTVAVYVVLWAKLLKLWPLLASCCKPAEDLAKRSLIKEVNGISYLQKETTILILKIRTLRKLKFASGTRLLQKTRIFQILCRYTIVQEMKFYL